MEEETDEDNNEAEVDLEAELIAALDELEKERKWNKKASRKLDIANNIIVSLKLQVEESKKIQEDLEVQLIAKVENYCKLEEEIVGLRMQLEEMSQKIDKYQVLEGRSTKLAEIIKGQRNSSDRSGLGFDKGESSSMPVTKNPIVFKKEEKKLTKEDAGLERNVDDGFTKVQHQRRRKFIAPTNSWQKPQIRFNLPFNGYCFKCNAYGHKLSDCKFNDPPRTFVSRNPFGALMEHPIECYNCHNFGHIAKFCRNRFASNSGRFQSMRQDKKVQENSIQGTKKAKQAWKEKERLKNDEKSLLIQTALKVQDKPAPWILDSGCSSHMTGDKRRFEKLQQYEGGSVKFGNNDGAKIVGRGTVKINDGKIRSEEVLFVIGLKHSLLSVSQICDKGNNVIFMKDGCEVRRANSGKLVAVGTRTSGNLYTLTETSEGSCLFCNGLHQYFDCDHP